MQILLGICILVSFGIIAYQGFRDIKNKEGGCHGGCSGCPSADNCGIELDDKKDQLEK